MSAATLLATHRFHTGEHVVYAAGGFRPRGIFEIIALLPVEDGTPMYHVKGENEAYKRRVAEFELAASADELDL